MNLNPLEKVIEAKVCEHAKKLGCYVRKFTSPSHRSVPDRMIITPNGIVFFIEFKRKGEVPTAGQVVEIEKIRKMGVKVFVVDAVEDGKNVVDAMVSKMNDPMF
jgi:hypothetical protein